MRCDVLAIGTELLLGQIVDTNSAWIGEQLAVRGHRHLRAPQGRRQPAAHGRRARGAARRCRRGHRVRRARPHARRRDARGDRAGDGRRARAARGADRADLVAVRDRAAATCRPTTSARPTSPSVAASIPNPIGTAPGLRCEVAGADGRKRVVYAVPGVPYEMQQMVTDHVLPDLLELSGERAVIVSRSLKTWGTSESGLAEMIAERVDVQTNPTIAFLARGIEGLYVRMTAKARDRGRGRRAARRRGRARCARSSGTSCSRSTTRRWSRRCSARARRAAGRSASPSR